VLEKRLLRYAKGYILRMRVIQIFGAARKDRSLKRICVLQNWGLGDLVMTVPVLSEIRRVCPACEVTLIVGGAVQVSLLSGSPLVDNIVILSQYAGRRYLTRFFLSLRAARFDVAFIGTRLKPLYAILLRILSGVPVIIGDGQQARWCYTYHSDIDAKVHRVDRMLQTLALWTGRHDGQTSYALPISRKGQLKAADRLATAGLSSGPYIAIHPGSAGGSLMKDKRLPTSLSLEIARTVVREEGIRVAVIFGPEDQDMIGDFAPPPDGVTVLSDMSLDETKAILARAYGFIGSDSSLGHIAAAYNIPTITVVGPTNPRESRPWGRRAIVVTSSEQLPCRPCWFTPLQGNCPNGQRCMTEISVEAIMLKVKSWKHFV
jgi:heptosyltransferase-2